MKLYKYLAPDRIAVLENCLIRHTQPQALNDPFEMRLAPWFKSLFPSSFVVFNKYSGKIEIVDVLTATMEKNFHKDLLVLCLTERPDNHLMWSHYSLSYQGFLIGFNSEHPWFHERKGPHDEFRHLKKVQYRNARPNQAKDYSVMDALLTKGIEWKYEEEWRIFRMARDADKIISSDSPCPIYLFRFPQTAVAEIVLGSNMNEENRKVIVAIAKNSIHLRHVNLKQAYLVDTDYQVRFKDITP